MTTQHNETNDTPDSPRHHGFQPGHPGGPGRPRGSIGGRARALAALDQILGEEESLAVMKTALRDYILRKPVTAFRRLVLPLLPRQMKLDVAEPTTVVWKSLLTQQPSPGTLASAAGTAGETP